MIYLGHEFLCHLKEALAMYEKHDELFNQFTATFHPDTIASWQKLVDAWKRDWSQPNPYLESGPCELVEFLLIAECNKKTCLATTLQDVCLKLAKEDSVLAATGTILPHKASSTSFLTICLELEEQQ